MAVLMSSMAPRQDKPAAFERETPDYMTVDLRLGFDVTDTIKLMLEARNLTR